MNTNTLYVTDHEVTFEFIDSLGEVKDILNDIKHLYPNFDSWLKFKFQKGSIKLGLRGILVARAHKSIAGVALLKKQNNEKKICTFFVAAEYRRQGVGSQLMSMSLKWLETDQPVITVSEERKVSLEPILRKFNFSHSKTLFGYYRENKAEYFYNI
jgi:GNAT superfamily N-acetyltransferase